MLTRFRRLAHRFIAASTPPRGGVEARVEQSASRLAAIRTPMAGIRKPEHRVLFRNASWNIIDQILSASSNVLLNVLVARMVTREQFGAFGVAFLVFNVCIGIERAIVGKPMNIRHSAAHGDQLRTAMSKALGAALLIGVVGGLLCALSASVLPGLLGPALLATAVVLPGMMVQDACRLVFFARGQAHWAALSDGLWAVLQFAAIAMIVVAGAVSVPAMIAAWGGAAALSAVVALVQLRVIPSLAKARLWLREHLDLSKYLVAEYLLGAGAFQGGILLVGALVGGGEGLAIIGAFRAAQVVLGPLAVISTAIMTFAVPEVSRRPHLTRGALVRVAFAVGAFLLLATLVYSIVLLILPMSVGQFLFRDSWAGAYSVLLPLALGLMFLALSQGAQTVIHALAKPRNTFRVMMIEAPLVLSLMVIGSRLGGAPGAAWGQCLDQLLLVPAWYVGLFSILPPHPGQASKPAPVDRPVDQGSMDVPKSGERATDIEAAAAPGVPRQVPAAQHAAARGRGRFRAAG